jgi:hypothetical protein
MSGDAPFLTTESAPLRTVINNQDIVRLPLTRATLVRSSFSMRSCRSGERTPRYRFVTLNSDLPIDVAWEDARACCE